MSNISAIEIAALCAHHCGVSPRDLALDRELGAAWTHVDDATALALTLIRRHTPEPWLRIARLLNRPGGEGQSAALRVWIDTNTRLRRDDLLATSLAELETQIEDVHEARVALSMPRRRRLAA